MNATPKHPTETEEYWRSLARNERAFAREDRQRRYGTVESIRIHEQNAREYDAEADRLAAVSAGEGR